jgi:hypothetical protein
VFVSVVKWRDSFHIQGGQQFDSLASRHILFVLLATALTFRDIAGKQYNDRMQAGTGEPSNPMIRVIRACGAEDACSRSHALTELFREGGQCCFSHTKRSQTVPGEANAHPPGVK